MLIRCPKCHREEEVSLHKDGYEVVHAVCGWCKTWNRKFIVPEEPERPSLKSFKKAHIAQ